MKPFVSFAKCIDNEIQIQSALNLSPKQVEDAHIYLQADTALAKELHVKQVPVIIEVRRDGTRSLLKDFGG